MAKIRMGVIGLGGISGMHIAGINKSPDAELTAICDIRDEVLWEKGDYLGIPENRRFKSHIDLLACSEVDAVTICASNSTHYSITKDAIKYRKPFILEKPVTLNYSESLELLDLARQYNVPNMIGFSYRFKAAARYARSLIEQGHLGKIYHIYGQYFQSWAISEKVPLVWRFQKEYAGSGALGDLGSHMIDLARFLAGDFKKVCGHSGTFIKQRKKMDSDEFGKVDVDDFCHVMAELDNGIAGSFSITRDAYGRGNYQRIEIYGSKGGLIYNLDKEGDMIDSIQVCIGDIYNNARKYQEIPVPSQYRSDQMQAFFDIINGKGDGTAATIEDGCINQLIIDSIITSFEEERWVPIKEESNK